VLRLLVVVGRALRRLLAFVAVVAGRLLLRRFGVVRIPLARADRRRVGGGAARGNARVVVVAVGVRIPLVVAAAAGQPPRVADAATSPNSAQSYDIRLRRRRRDASGVETP
jgi:hypothetical protein